MRLYLNNIVAVHAALVVCIFAWLWGGMRGPALVPIMPWLVAFLIEVMLFFPEHRGPDESTYQARERVWKAMRRDPLVWIEIVFMALLVIPFANNGLCPNCDAAAIAQGANPKPLVGFLPYCVNRLNHLTVFLWFLPTLTAVTAVKHSLTKHGKRLFCEMIVWNATLLAVFGFVQQVLGAPGPLWWDVGLKGTEAYFFSTFGYPNAGGAFFASCFALSVAVWRRRDDDVREEIAANASRRLDDTHSLFWKRHYMAIPTALIFYATLNTLSRAAIAFVTVAAALLLAHATICMLARLSKARRVKAGAIMGLAAALLAVLISIFMPEEVKSEMSTIKNSNEALDRFTCKSEYHSRVAIDLLWDHPLFGCGGWGYAHLSPTKLTEEEMKTHARGFGAGSANVHNDYLQFLAEHGIIGFGCLVAIAVLLLIPVGRTWKKLFKTTQFADKKLQPARPRALFVLPAGAFAVMIAALVILLHAFADCPLRSPAVLSLLFCELAAIDGFLPRFETEHEEEG